MSKTREVKQMEAARRPSWGQVNRQRLHYVLKHSGKTVLDVGCATGRYVELLNSRGQQAFGIDLLPYKEWRKAHKGSFIQGTGLHLPFSEQAFETVLAFEVLEHISNPHQALLELHRVCQNVLLVSVPDAAQVEDLSRAGLAFTHWLDRTHVNFFDEKSLVAILKAAGFEIETITRINPVFTDYPVLRSWHVPAWLAYPSARITARLPFRKQYRMTLLAVARKDIPVV